MMRQLIERLETKTRTGVTLRVLSGGKDPTAQGAPPAPAAASPVSPKTMAAMVAQAERLPISRRAGVPVGDTLERGALRMHRYESALRVTDITNAGKRGKTCPEFALYNLDFPLPEPGASAVDDALAAIAKAGTYAKAVAIAREAVAAAKAVFSNVNIEENALRGVDVDPPAGAMGAPIKLDLPNFSLEATATGFAVHDKGDTNNYPVLMTPSGGKRKTAIKAFHAWATANKAALPKMKFDDVHRALRTAGIDYHYFLSMD